MSSTNYLVVALLGRRLLLLLLITCLQLRCGGSFHNIIPIIIRREQSPVTTKLKFVRNIGGDTTTADYSPSSNSANSCRRSRDETIATATKWKWQTATTTSTTSGRKPAVIRLCASQLYGVTNATESTRTSTTTTTTTTENRSVIIPPGVLGPPEELRRLNLGQSLTAVRKAMVAVDDDCMESNGPQQSVSEKELRYTIERVSFTPDVFVLRKSVKKLMLYSLIHLCSLLLHGPTGLNQFMNLEGHLFVRLVCLGRGELYDGISHRSISQKHFVSTCVRAYYYIHYERIRSSNALHDILS